MSIFATFVGWIAGKLAALYVAALASRALARVTVLTAIAAGYVSLVVLFSTTVAPWFGAIAGTGYGQLLGLAFPPAAGTVLASLGGFWAASLAWRYWSSLSSAAVK